MTYCFQRSAISAGIILVAHSSIAMGSSHHSHHKSATNDQVMACGNIQCHNGGQCVDISFVNEAKNSTDSSSTLEANAKASGDLLTFCQCPVGFSGVTCEVKHDNICGSDQTVCKSGRECVENKQEAGVNECPCDVAFEISLFAGYMCEKPATEYCDQYNHETGHRYFCTNGGICANTLVSDGVSVNEDSWGDVESDRSTYCICPPDFTGRHCETLRGWQVSDEYPALSAMERREARFGIAIFSLVLLSATVFLLGFAMKRHLVGSHKDQHIGEDEETQSNDLRLESNGVTNNIDKDMSTSGIHSPTSVNTLDIDQIVDVTDESKFV